MQRDLHALVNQTFDLAAIGGSINGAAIAREVAICGLKVALVEAQDFANGTSSRSSKLIHGGLRYLERFGFTLVRESRRERQLLLAAAAHREKIGVIAAQLNRTSLAPSSAVLPAASTFSGGKSTKPTCAPVLARLISLPKAPAR
jgi:glycerol-3-phosphate dehydrogenase